MKKNLITILLAAAVLGGATAYVATPQAPDHYELHIVTYGETLESIIQDSNKNFDVNYNIRDAVTEAVTQSKKMEGGATSRQLQVGDKVAVPIYRR